MTLALSDINGMGPYLAVFIMMNNYFHDVATAMLVACGVAMWALLPGYENNKGPEAKALLLRIYQGISGIVTVSVIWIAAAGALRVLTLDVFEWKNAVDKGHTHGLITKYIIAAVMVAAGPCLLVAVRKRIRKIRDSNVL